MKKKMTAILCLLILAGCLCGCGKKKETAVQTTYTSEELQVYRAILNNGVAYVVDGEGKALPNYQIDESGNITASGNILIKAEDVKEFKSVTAIISLSDTPSIEATLMRQIKAGTVDEYENMPALYEYKLYVSPSDANRPQLRVSSSDSSVAEIEAGAKDVPENGTVLCSPEEGIVSVYVRCKNEGKATVTATTTDESNISYSFEVHVEKQKEPERNEEELIPTTENTPGWISGTNVRFRKSPDSTGEVKAFFNTGKDLAILGEGDGWTKCLISGEVGYVKSEFVSRVKPSTETPQVNAPTNNYRTATPTPAPTNTAPVTANDGNDHGYAYGAVTENRVNAKTAAASAENHTHYYVKYKVVPPTKTERGYTIYKCDCGASYRTNYKAATAGGEISG